MEEAEKDATLQYNHWLNKNSTKENYKILEVKVNKKEISEIYYKYNIIVFYEN